MAVHWQTSECEAYKTAKAADDASPEKDGESDEWRKFCVMRDALIWALIRVGFPGNSEWKITEDNWEQVFIRIHMLEHGTDAYRTRYTEDHEVKPVYFKPFEIRSMIGMSVNAGNKSEQKFTAEIISQLKREATDSLRYALEREKDHANGEPTPQD